MTPAPPPPPYTLTEPGPLILEFRIHKLNAQLNAQPHAQLNAQINNTASDADDEQHLSEDGG